MHDFDYSPRATSTPKHRPQNYERGPRKKRLTVLGLSGSRHAVCVLVVPGTPFGSCGNAAARLPLELDVVDELLTQETSKIKFGNHRSRMRIRENLVS